MSFNRCNVVPYDNQKHYHADNSVLIAGASGTPDIHVAIMGLQYIQGRRQKNFLGVPK